MHEKLTDLNHKDPLYMDRAYAPADQNTKKTRKTHLHPLDTARRTQVWHDYDGALQLTRRRRWLRLRWSVPPRIAQGESGYAERESDIVGNSPVPFILFNPWCASATKYIKRPTL